MRGLSLGARSEADAQEMQRLAHGSGVPLAAARHVTSKADEAQACTISALRKPEVTSSGVRFKTSQALATNKYGTSNVTEQVSLGVQRVFPRFLAFPALSRPEVLCLSVTVCQEAYYYN